MDQTTKYRQLQPEERMTMASMKQQGSSARAMARALGRSPSTITRELARNTLTAMPYASHRSQVASFSRRVAARPAAKLALDGVGWGVVRTMLAWKWSPQQIAATLKRVFPDEPERHVSHETIYTAIYAQPRAELNKLGSEQDLTPGAVALAEAQLALRAGKLALTQAGLAQRAGAGARPCHLQNTTKTYPGARPTSASSSRIDSANRQCCTFFQLVTMRLAARKARRHTRGQGVARAAGKRRECRYFAK